MKVIWALYCRLPNRKHRKRVMEYDNEGEACVALCGAVAMFPGRDWKLRKVKNSVSEVER